METITQEELNEIIEEHELCLNTERANGEILYLIYFDLSNLDFSGRNLRNAIFYGCDFKNAKFSGSDLTNVWFNNCNNLETIITDENTLPKIHCPEKGEFVGYKKCLVSDGVNIKSCIVKILIPDSAKRSSGTGNRCRCSKAYVLGFYDFDGNEIKFGNNEVVISHFDYMFTYKLNEWVYPNNFNKCRWNDFTHGIHFFMSFDEAVKCRL